MCVNCIRSQVDITEGIQKQVTVLWCKDCGRYLQPPKHWLRAELESKELLTFCIKKIKGLSKVGRSKGAHAEHHAVLLGDLARVCGGDWEPMRVYGWCGVCASCRVLPALPCPVLLCGGAHCGA